MKLLMITGLGSAKDLASGKKGAFYNTLEEFHKYWERVDIVCPRIKSEKLKVKNLFGNVHLHISPWPLIFHPIWFLKKGLEIYREQKFDLMTVHEFPPFYNGIAARLLWQKIKAPYVLEVFHIPGYPRAANLKELIYKLLFKLFMKFDVSKAKAVRVMNQKQVPDFLKKIGVPESKIIYIPAIYIDLDVFKPANLPQNYDLIFVGRLAENKGVNLLIDAVKSLGVKAIIVGDGPLTKILKLKVKNEKLEKQVTFYGWAKDQKEIAELLNKSKILVMPSYNEGGPRVVLEAMACGVPVLATPVGVVPDLEKTGALEMIDWNAGNISEKAKNLLANDTRYWKLSKLGIEVAKKFERKNTIKNYAEQLKKIP